MVVCRLLQQRIVDFDQAKVEINNRESCQVAQDVDEVGKGVWLGQVWDCSMAQIEKDEFLGKERDQVAFERRFETV